MSTRHVRDRSGCGTGLCMLARTEFAGGGVFLLLLVLGLGAWLGVGNVAWFSSLNFVVHDAANTSLLPFGFGYLRKVCKQCGLVLDPAVLEKAKALEGAEL